MLSSILIIAFSVVLLVYWFRYSCILILRNQHEQKQTAAASARFGLAEIQARLKVEPELDPLHRSLDRDYKVIQYLLHHAVGLELDSLEDRILVLDYRIMQFVYRITRTAAPKQARQALVEMASVLDILDHHIGSRAGVQSES